MKTTLPALFCFAMTATLAPNALAAARCALTPLIPHGRTAAAGKATVNLGDADDPSAPTAWQGPLKAGRCTFETGIIEQPLALTPSQLLYLTAYSGNMRTVALFDLNTCSVRWKSAPFSGKVALRESALTLGQKRIALDDRCLPKMDKKVKTR